MSRDIYYNALGDEVYPDGCEADEESNSSALACSIAWSEKAPTEPGWYWLEADDYGLQVVSVSETLINREFSLVVAFTGDSVGRTMARFVEDCKWAGPIPEPVEQ